LEGSTALEVKDLVVVTQTEQALDCCAGFVHYPLEILVAMRNFNKGESGSVEVQEGSRGLFQYGTGKNGRTCAKVVNFHGGMRWFCGESLRPQSYLTIFEAV
jgi:hypothetical protein